jgi:hypothetical protein
LCYSVSEKSGEELMPLIIKTLEDNGKMVDSDSLKFGMISLHSCGDLSPNILKIFHKNKAHIKFLVNFGCCYHKMEEISANNFKNFPLSQTLRNKFDERYSHFKLSKYALRVGGQENL